MPVMQIADGSRLLARAELLHDEIAGTGDIPSPCVGVCRMTADRQLCEGCFRTLDEIRDWAAGDALGRRATWVRAVQRARAATTR
jgi:predicted Fe-S protein YdhL (DUF1289 family)